MKLICRDFLPRTILPAVVRVAPKNPGTPGDNQTGDKEVL
jgi:hypothetical protein